MLNFLVIVKRYRRLRVKFGFKKDLSLSFPFPKKESQKHIVKFPVITRRNPNKVHINYRDLKSDNVEEQVKVVKYFKENYIIRSQLLENMKTT